MLAQIFKVIFGATPWGPGLRVAGLGVALGISTKIEIELPSGVKLSLVRGVADLPEVVIVAFETLAVAMITVGVSWAILASWQDHRRKSRMKIIVIEVRGLRDVDSPLPDALPKTLKGVRDQVLVDLRQGIVDGKIIDPKVALGKLTAMMQSISGRRQGIASDSVNIVYGGLAPVPFTFLAGAWLDDEGKLTVMDWDRHAERWRTSEGADDNRRFHVSGMEAVPDNAKEVALIVSVSYQIQKADVRFRLGEDVPIVSMTLPHIADGVGWSLEQQRALGKQFFQVAKSLGGKGARRIHLFLAAENRLVVQLGRLYDLRNLPDIAVYQYQQENIPPHPWAILLTAQGAKNATIVEGDAVKLPSQTADH